MNPSRTTSRRWKRARRAALFLILGAIVNVGVAWGTLHLPRSPYKSSWWTKEWYTKTNRWPIRVPEDWPPPYVVEGSRYFAMRQDFYRGGPLPAQLYMSGWKSPGDTHKMSILRSGWPMYSMRTWAIKVGNEWGPFEQHWGWKVGFAPSKPDQRRLLPLNPIPLGFTLNTLFYAAALYIPFHGLGALKRRRRVRRGLCPRCAYDLAGLTICPECGTARA